MKWRLLQIFNLKCGGVMARSVGEKLPRAVPWALVYPELPICLGIWQGWIWFSSFEFSSFEICFYLQEKPCIYFVQYLYHGRIGLMELPSSWPCTPLPWWPAAEETAADTGVPWVKKGQVTPQTLVEGLRKGDLPRQKDPRNLLPLPS